MSSAPSPIPPDGRTLTVHTLRISLLDVTPKVWRLLRVPSAITLAVLHGVFQVALGWQNYHLHEWRVGDLTFGPPDEEDWGDPLGDESSMTLTDVAPLDSSLIYAYDMGDGWEHLVEVVSIDPYEGTVRPVEVLDGARAVPPEDCGGPSGYEHLLDALADPDDPEHDELLEWVGDALDPERFDRREINFQLEGLWRPDIG